jgi:drug/metabolite transporter (DMT)-like permease
MGVIAALLCAFTSTAKDLTSKSIASRVHPDVSTFASFLFALPYYAAILSAVLLFGGETVTFSSAFIVLVLLRGISDVFAEGFKMRALEAGDVSLVTGLLSLSPLILTVLTPVLTNDTVSAKEGVSVVLIVIGGLLLIGRRGTRGTLTKPKAILYSLAGSFAFAMNTVLDKLAVAQAGPVTSAFSVTICAALLTLPALLRVPLAKPQLQNNLRSLLLRGLFETVFMIAKMAALVVLPAHIVMGIMRVSILLTVVLGGALFKEEHRAQRIFGTLVMYLGLLGLLL